MTEGIIDMDESWGQIHFALADNQLVWVGFEPAPIDIRDIPVTTIGKLPRAIEREATRASDHIVHSISSGQPYTLPMRLIGTPFQIEVWEAIKTIPWGETTTYAVLAQKIGRPTAHRAVASAVGANPISILIPCHRVIRSTGELGGYRWGEARKRALLDREKNRA